MWRVIFIPLALLACSTPASAAAPEALTGLHSTGSGLRTVSLAWNAPATPHPFVEVSLFGPAPGGLQFGGSSWESSTVALTESELVCGSTYTISAAWSDDAALPSGPPATVQAATQPCTQAPPAAPSGMHAAPDDTDIVFGWDAPPAGVTLMDLALAGPGLTGAAQRLAPAASYDPLHLVCGEAYLLRLRWIDDQGQTSPASQLSASTLACPAGGGAGPANLRVSSATTSSVAFAWDAFAGPGLWMPRTTLTGGAPFTYLSRTATTTTLRSLTCGTPVALSVQWVFLDGSVSDPSTLAARTADCALPIVATGPVTSFGATFATLSGAVTPNGSDTSYHFEYGPTTAYGARTAERDAGRGTTPHNAVATIGPLVPLTTYHFRLVAANAAGPVAGGDQSFTTPAATPPTTFPVTPPAVTPVTRATCKVPRLKGVKLATAKRRLTHAHCRLGKVTRKHGRHGRVLATRPGAGKHTTGKVDLTVGR